jgi:hypothetical protein
MKSESPNNPISPDRHPILPAVMTAFHTACHRVRIYGHPCSANGKIPYPYMDATGAFLDCYVIPWGRLSEEPGHG